MFHHHLIDMEVPHLPGDRHQVFFSINNLSKDYQGPSVMPGTGPPRYNAGPGPTQGPAQHHQGQGPPQQGSSQHGYPGAAQQPNGQAQYGYPGSNIFSNPVFQNQHNLVNYHLMRSYYGDLDAIQQLDRGISRLDLRITSAISTQCYDHVEWSLKELVRLRSILSEARHCQNFTNDIVDQYIIEFLRIEDELTKQRRFAKKEEEKIKGKSKVLTGLHKSPLPVIKDSLDIVHWRRQVNELMKALSEEGDSPVMRQKVCTAVKASIKGPRFSQMAKTLEVSQDLTQVLNLIQGYCKNVYNILDDLKHRLDKLSTPRSRVVMYNNCLQIVSLIRQ